MIVFMLPKHHSAGETGTWPRGWLHGLAWDRRDSRNGSGRSPMVNSVSFAVFGFGERRGVGVKSMVWHQSWRNSSREKGKKVLEWRPRPGIRY